MGNRRCSRNRHVCQRARLTAVGLIASERHRVTTIDQMEALGVLIGPTVLEPLPRNTAIVAIVAALSGEAHTGSAVVLLPAYTSSGT